MKNYVTARSGLARRLKELRRKVKDPLKILNRDKNIRDKFLLEMTYHSNAIEGSRMTIKETKMAFEGKKIRGKEMFEVFEAVNHKNAMEFLLDSVRPDFKINAS